MHAAGDAGIEGPIDYINAHGTSTPAGDIVELNAIKTVFGMNAPVIGSTKSLSGHRSGQPVQEAIYSILMMQSDFIAASANIETIDLGAEGMPIVLHRIDKPINMILSNSFGFGGTNACMTFQKPQLVKLYSSPPLAVWAKSKDHRPHHWAIPPNRGNRH